MTELRADERRMRVGSRRIDSMVKFWLRFSQDRLAVASLFILSLLSLVALVSPLVFEDPLTMHIERPDQILRAPDLSHLMGTDQFGRDIMTRIAWGSRISLSVGFLASILSTAVGIVLGSLAGYYGGIVDAAISRLVDTFITLPRMFLALLVAAMFGSSIVNVMIVISLTIWPSTARLVRSEFLSHKEQPYVESARSVGAGDLHIIFREILPNTVYPAVVNTTILMSYAIILESGLSFLGLGDPTTVSWGKILNDSLKLLRTAWWVFTFPGLAIAATILSCNAVGDGLNYALNPQMRARRL